MAKVAKTAALMLISPLTAFATDPAGAAQLLLSPVSTLLGGLMPKPPPAVGGAALGFKADPAAPIPYAFGRTAVGGNIIFAQTHGPANKPAERNKHLSYFTILSGGGPIEAISAFYANEELVPFAGEAATGRYAGRMWQTRQLGAVPSPRLAPPAQPASDSPLPEWTAAHKLSGYAATIWGLETNAKDKTPLTSTPKPLWVVSGTKCYHPWLDSTYPGGSGPQRVDDESTWTWSDNPFVVGLTWAIGRHQNGKRVLGIGAPPAAIDMAAFVEGASICYANGWTCGGVVTSADSKWDVLTAILQSGGGWPMRLGARISCGVQTPRVSIDTVTSGDIVGDASIAAVQPRRDRINRVIPRYRSEAHKWQMVAAGVVAVAAYVAADGGERTREIEYGFVQNPKQAAELARYAIEDGREIGPITLPLKPRWRGIKPGDCITVDEPELGLNGQKVLVLRRSTDLQTGGVTLECRSEADGKHPFALGQVADPPPARALTGVDLQVIPAPAFGAWTATGGAVAQTPTVFVTGAADNPNATGIIVEYRLTAESAWTTYEEAPSTATRFEISVPRGQTAYTVGISYRTRGGIGDRRELTSVTTGGIAWTGVTGPGRPEDYATVGATIRDNGTGNLLRELPGGGMVALTPSDILNSLVTANFQAEVDQLRADVQDFIAGGLDLATERLTEAFAEQRELEEGFHTLIGSLLDRRDERIERTRLTHLDGRPVGSVVEQEQTRTNTLVETVSLIGVVSPDGGSLIFNRNKVVWDQATGKTFAEKVEEMESATGSALASISNVQTVLTTAISAEATTRNSQYSTLNNAIAGVDSRVTTVASDLSAATVTSNAQFSALGNTIAGVQTSVSTVATNLSAETTARQQAVSQLGGSIAGVDQRVTTAVTALNAETTTRTQQFSSLGSSIASVDQRVTTVANALSAETTTRTTQFSQLGGSIAAVDNRVTTTANALAAETITRNTQVSQLGQNIATVQSNVDTVATALAAETTTRATQISQVGQAVAAVDSRVTTVANDLSAETSSRTTQASQLGQSIAVVDQRVTTTANALSAETTARTTQISQVNGRVAAVEQTTATLVDPATGLPVATFRVKTAATGSTPAELELISGGGSSFIRLAASYIGWGDDTVFVDASNTLETTKNGTKHVHGDPFGPDSLVEWIGLAGTATADASRANAQFYIATTAPYVGGAAIAASTPEGRARGASVNTVFGPAQPEASTLTLGAISAGGLWDFTIGPGLSNDAGFPASGGWTVEEQNTDGGDPVLVTSGSWMSVNVEPTEIRFTGAMSGSTKRTANRRLRLYLTGTNDKNLSVPFSARYFPPA